MGLLPTFNVNLGLDRECESAWNIFWSRGHFLVSDCFPGCLLSFRHLRYVRIQACCYCCFYFPRGQLPLLIDPFRIFIFLLPGDLPSVGSHTKCLQQPNLAGRSTVRGSKMAGTQMPVLSPAVYPPQPGWTAAGGQAWEHG